MMTRILLTGAGSPAVQNFLACLRMAPEPFHIVGCDMNRYHLEWGALDAAYEAPPSGTEEYLDFLNDLIEREQIDFVHGQADWEVAFLSEHADELRARTFYPRPEVIQTAQNKYAAATIWAEAGLRSKPELVADQWDLVIGDDFPLWLRATRGAGARGSCLAQNAEQAMAWLGYWEATGADWEFMVEEYLPGPEYAFSSLWYEGQLICSSARERVEKCSNLQLGGAGVTSSPIVARIVHDGAVNEVATAAIQTLDPLPHGVYSVDLKADAEGTPRPTECNAGRFFTTSRFLAEGGCNMPWAFVRLGYAGFLPDDLGREWGPKSPYNMIPEGLLWIRHIDCGQVLSSENRLRSHPLAQRKEACAVPGQ